MEQKTILPLIQSGDEIENDIKYVVNQMVELCVAESKNFAPSEVEHNVPEKQPTEESTKNDEEFKLYSEKFSKETDLKVLLEVAKDQDSKYRLIALKRSLHLLPTNKSKEIEVEFLPVLTECLHLENSKNERQIIHIVHCICRRHSDAISVLITLLVSQTVAIRKNVLHIFQAIMLNTPEFRDKCFEMGFMPAFINISNEDAISAADVAGVILSMYRSTNKPVPIEVVRQLLPILDLHLQINDIDVLENTFKTIWLLAGINTENLLLLNEYKFIEKVLSYFGHANKLIKNYAIVTIFIIADGTEEQTKSVINAGAIPMLLPLLETTERIMKNFIFEKFRTIVKKSVEFRDSCIEHGLVQTLLKLLDGEPTTSRLHDIISLAENVCQSFRYPISLETTTLFLPLINKYVHHENLKICRKVIAIIFHILNKRNFQMNQFLIDNETIKEVIPFLHHSDEKLQLQTLRAINALIFGCLEQANYVVSMGVMKYMEELLAQENELIQENALLFIRKIITKPNKHGHIVINSKFIPLILQLFKHPNAKIQRESVWTISQCLMVSKIKQMNAVFNVDFIPSFCSFLNSTDIFLVKIVLNGINSLLQKSDNHKVIIRQKLIECGTAEKISAMMENDNADIRSLCTTIMKNYFTVRGSSVIGNLIQKKRFMPF